MAPLLSRSIALAAALLIVPIALVFACEADCKSNITTALIGNYSTPVNDVFTQLAERLQTHLGPNSDPPSSYLAPIIQEYQANAYSAMENDVFAKLFHGKCQNPTTGIDPPGCPNPDCPVICGTPGSMVHFFSTFRQRAFDSTAGLLESIVKPNSPAYQKVRHAVEASPRSRPNRGRAIRFMRNLVPPYAEPLLVGHGLYEERRKDRFDDTMFSDIRDLLAVACGGSRSGKLNDLQNCSWESSFKQFILTFP